jgi:hypothetical protein
MLHRFDEVAATRNEIQTTTVLFKQVEIANFDLTDLVAWALSNVHNVLLCQGQQSQADSMKSQGSRECYGTVTGMGFAEDA